MKVLLFVAVFGMLTVAVTLAVIALVVWQLRKHNRVSPDHPSAAPVAWLVSPIVPARLHRRLRNTVLVARSAAAEYPNVADLARQIEAQAIALDRHTIVAARLRSQRFKAVRELTDQVDQLEAVTLRLAAVAIDSQRLPALPGERDDPLAAIADRLDSLDAARADLAALEGRAGLELPG